MTQKTSLHPPATSWFPEEMPRRPRRQGQARSRGARGWSASPLGTEATAGERASQRTLGKVPTPLSSVRPRGSPASFADVAAAGRPQAVKRNLLQAPAVARVTRVEGASPSGMAEVAATGSSRTLKTSPMQGRRGRGTGFRPGQRRTAAARCQGRKGNIPPKGPVPGPASRRSR